MNTILTAEEQAVANDVAAVLDKAKTVLGAITGSPLTAEAEKVFPGIVGIVTKLGIAGTAAGAAAAAIPMIEAVIGLYQAGLVRGAEPTDPVFQRQGNDPYTNDMGNGDSGGN